MFLIGIIATIAIPNFRKFMPHYKRKEFFDHFDALTRLAWQQALVTQKAHRVFFDFEKRILRIEQAKQNAANTKPEFEPAQIPYVSSSYQWAENIVIKQFYIYAEDMLARQGIKTEHIWFYIAPDGLAQPVIINLIDTSEKDNKGEPYMAALILNPFNAHINYYETFQKP